MSSNFDQMGGATITAVTRGGRFGMVCSSLKTNSDFLLLWSHLWLSKSAATLALRLMLHFSFAQKVMSSGRVDYLGLSDQAAMSDAVTDVSARGMANRPVKIDPVNDLAFDVYQDPNVAATTKKLSKLKQKCVEEEDYATANQLKKIIDGLKKVVFSV